MKPETRFWKWLRGKLPRGHFCRVEPPPSPGIPDVNYCIKGVEGWIELKMGLLRERPFNARNKGLRISQKRWIRERLKTNGRVFVLVSRGSEVLVLSGAYAVTTTKQTTISEMRTCSLAVLDKKGETFTRELYAILENGV